MRSPRRSGTTRSSSSPVRRGRARPRSCRRSAWNSVSASTDSSVTLSPDGSRPGPWPHASPTNSTAHSDTTRVKVMTDGILLAELSRDKLLRDYEVIIIDEAHERSLNIDFLLGYLKQVLGRRPDLKVIITSATIDPESFSSHFDNAPVI